MGVTASVTLARTRSINAMSTLPSTISATASKMRAIKEKRCAMPRIGAAMRLMVCELSFTSTSYRSFQFLPKC